MEKLLANTFYPRLKRGEVILWLGRPVVRPQYTRQLRLEFTLTLAVISGLGWAYYALSGYPMPRLAILGVLLMLVAALFLPLVLEPIAARIYLRRTAYAITTERALILSGKQFYSQPLNANTRFRLSSTLPATLVIWDATDQARAEVSPLRFQSLADGGAARVLQQLLEDSG